MEIEYFKTKLSKGQLEALAIDAVTKQLESANEHDIYRFAKKLLFFAGHLVKESEDRLKDVWADGDKPEDMNYTTGAAIYNYEKDPVYDELKRALKERKDLLDAARRLTDPVYDVDGAEVPKVPVKSFRKDSINVKI